MFTDERISKMLDKTEKDFVRVISKESSQAEGFRAFHMSSYDTLREADREVYNLIEKEYERQRKTIQLIAAENQCSKAVLAALGSVVQDKTTEGFPGSRFHGGCEHVDEMEKLACERAKLAFRAKYANVQPHSGTNANQIVMTAVLNKDDKILSLGLDQGGHVSHGANVSLSGKFFRTENYYVEEKSYQLDYSKIREHAKVFRPKLIICGATAYARVIDFKKFREIADEVGAYLMADISHIAGLVIAGAHMSPIDYAHFTTTSTYKPGGPRGGLILMGRDFNTEIQIGTGTKTMPLWRLIDKTTFPGVQGTPYLNHIAAKAVFFQEACGVEYKSRQFRIIENAKALAKRLLEHGFDVLTGGTENHMVLVDVTKFRSGMTGVIAQKSLEECGIVINMNRLPYDIHPAGVTSGMRLGTPIVTKNGMGSNEMIEIADIVADVLKNVEIINNKECHLKDDFKAEIYKRVEALCDKFPRH